MKYLRLIAVLMFCKGVAGSCASYEFPFITGSDDIGNEADALSELVESYEALAEIISFFSALGGKEVNELVELFLRLNFTILKIVLI